MIVGATVHEVVSFTGAAGGGGSSLFAKRSKLVPRGLQLSRDRRKLVVADTPDMTSLVFDRTLKMEEVESVTLGVGDALYATWERLKKPPPRWCCATIVAAGASLHFVFADEAFALAWVLGLQRLAPEKAPRDVEGVLMWRKARWRLQERAAAEQRSVRDVVMQALREAAPEAPPPAAEEVPAEAEAVAAAEFRFLDRPIQPPAGVSSHREWACKPQSSRRRRRLVERQIERGTNYKDEVKLQRLAAAPASNGKAPAHKEVAAPRRRGGRAARARGRRRRRGRSTSSRSACWAPPSSPPSS